MDPRGVVVFLLALIAFPAARSMAADHVGQVTLGALPVPGVKVTASQGDRHVSTSTNRDGTYRFTGLDDGRWSIRVEMLGFSPMTREITLAADGKPETWELTVLPFTEITRGIPLPAPAPPANGSRGSTAPATQRRQDGEQARTNAGQPPGTFQRAGVTATPGVTNAPPGAAAPRGPALGAGFTDDAPNASGDSFLVNGSVNNSAAPSISQAAALGNARRALGIRLYSGGISVNGGSSALDARPQSLTGRPAAERNYHDLNVTANFGGPIRIPGLLSTGPNITLNYTRTSTTNANTLSETMPTLLQRSGNFSQTVDGFGRPVQIVDPATGLPFADNTIPADRLSPQAQALLRYYPLPDPEATGTFNYQIPSLNAQHSDVVRVNVPQLISRTRYQFGGGAGYTRSDRDSTSLFGFDNRSEGSGFDTQVNWIYRLASTAQMRLRHQYSRQTNTTEPFFANVTNVSGEAGITGNNQDPINWGPPSLVFASGIAGLSDSQYSFNRTQTHTFGGETLKAMGRQQLTFGGNARRQQLDLVQQQNARGGFTFNGSATGYDFADFLLGVPSTSAIAYGNADKNFRSWTFDAYLTDDFRVSPNFTIQMGVRWDYEQPITEALGRLVNLDVASDFSTAAPVIGDDPVGPITGRRYPTALMRSDGFAIEPRLGIAWRPIAGSSVVIRAGYGLYRNTNVYQSMASLLSQQPPLSRTFNSVNTPDTPLTLADGFVAPTSNTLNTFAIDPDFRIGAVHRWQASAQRDVLGSLTATATYMGGRGFNVMQAFLPNTYAPGAENPCPACPSGFVYLTSHGSSIQNSVQLQLRRRLRSGLTWTTAYTLGKATDNAAGFSGAGSIGGAGVNGLSIAQNWLDLDAERGPSSFDQRHQWTAQLTYTTGQGVAGGALLTGLKGLLVKGWTINTQMTTGSGSPLTPTYRATSVAGVTGSVRPALTGEPVDAAPEGYYVNPAAFAPPAPGTWGNAGRNSLRGPKPFSLNANLTRSFSLPNRITLDWQLDAQNVLNRLTYSSIDTVVGSSRFGLPVATTGARRIRASLRMRF